MNRNVRSILPLVLLLGLVAVPASRAEEPATDPSATEQAEAVDFTTQVQPILTRYCAGCHGAREATAELSVQSFATLMKGSISGQVIEPGSSEDSLLILLVTGAFEPVMPPEGEPRPSDEEIAVLRKWIDAGAVGPEYESPLEVFRAPALRPSAAPAPITALAVAPSGGQVALGQFQTVAVLDQLEGEPEVRWTGLPGKVMALAYLDGGQRLLAASGINGLTGHLSLWNVGDRSLERQWLAHQDMIYALAVDADEARIASAGYDRQIHIWDRQTGELLRTLEGHNGAIFDLAFAPHAPVLASASADATIKIWNVDTGERLDTLSQPLKEQYSVDISPDGQWVVAGGADNRLRLWQLVSVDAPQINPLLVARYAHEGAVQRVRFATEGGRLVSVGADGSLKIWQAPTLTPVGQLPQQPASTQVLAIDPSDQRVVVGRMDGTRQAYAWPRIDASDREPERPLPVSLAIQDVPPPGDDPAASVAEQEPNDRPDQVQPVALPLLVEGTVFGRADSPGADVDLYRFQAEEGEAWIFEVRAARDKSPLDSRIRILHADGSPVPRVNLQAIRDSYFTFRGKDSLQTGDFRLHNWEEMRLNQYLYAAGEVVKLYTYPRGPDSGFNVYPNFGLRHAYFDTTPVAHALNEPCYIVRPVHPDAELVPNGLPVFTINYQNDDDSLREWGTDSRLTFVAPASGEYLVAVDDARGWEGEAFRYRLSAHPPRPDFEVTLSGTELSIPRSAGRKFGINLRRIDGFDGPVRIDIDNLPDGLVVTSPIIVEPEQLRAWGTVFATPGAEVDPAAVAEIRITATATVGDRKVVKEVGGFQAITLADPAPVQVALVPDTAAGEPGVICVRPGTTTTATIRIERHDFDPPVGFGNEEAVVNAPHGVFVDRIGLNGVLIVEGQNTRTIYLTTEPWVEPGERWVFIEASCPGNPSSAPVRLRVLPSENPSG